MNNRRNNNRRTLIITLIILMVLSVFSQAENSVISGGLNLLTRGLFQLSAAATASADSATREDLAAEVEALKKENAELRRELADYIDTKAENERLWKYYELKKENPSYQIAPANIIRRDANDDFYSFTLDAGTAVGVSVNDPVITDSGLVGWVCQADAGTCRVQTILSPDTKAGVTDKQIGDSGILSGSVSLSGKNLTSMNKLAEDHQIKVGESGIYPAGLPVGEVQSLEFNQYDASRCAVIRPYEDVRNITAAAVITGFDTKGRVVKAHEE